MVVDKRDLSLDEFRMKKADLKGMKMFEFPIMCNVLPFYGKLQKWVWLLKGLSKGTGLMFDKNRNAFMKWGEEYRGEKSLSIENLAEGIDFLLQNWWLYEWFYLNELTLYKIFKSEIFKYDKSAVIFIEKSDQSNFEFKFALTYDDMAPKYIPSIKWENSKFVIESLKPILLSEFPVKDLRSKIEQYAIKIEIDSNSLAQIKILLSPAIRFYGSSVKGDYIKRYENCLNCRWCWKPTSILLDNYFKK